jgi:hypothetical protein
MSAATRRSSTNGPSTSIFACFGVFLGFYFRVHIIQGILKNSRYPCGAWRPCLSRSPKRLKMKQSGNRILALRLEKLPGRQFFEVSFRAVLPSRRNRSDVSKTWRGEWWPCQPRLRRDGDRRQEATVACPTVLHGNSAGSVAPGDDTYAIGHLESVTADGELSPPGMDHCRVVALRLSGAELNG